ncbi:hypothetical protein BN1318_1000008 [Staphylococcus capitis]|nr:hypothetical protein BN1318_1000008 [Staphylococcus capitis]
MKQFSKIQDCYVRRNSNHSKYKKDNKYIKQRNINNNLKILYDV